VNCRLALFEDSAQILASESHLYRKRLLLPESEAVILKALQSDSTSRRILGKGHVLEDGQVIGIRLNLNVLKSTGVLVHTVHRAGKTDGFMKGRGLFGNEVIAYLPVVTLRNVWFNVHQGQREAIATGKAAKSPMASVDGTFCDQSEHCFDGIELSCNPKRVHTFVDAENYGVAYAEHVTVLGHRCYARGQIRYFSQHDAPIKAGNAYSETRIKGMS
jgi:hypothetical protein